MARRFDTYYRTKRLDNLGDPEWHNRRWDDIDRRMDARERDATKIDNAVDDLEAVALARLNDSFSPIIAEAIDKLGDLGSLFKAHSLTEATIALGEATFTLTEDTRTSFVPFDYVAIRPTGDQTAGLTARVTSYDRVTGDLAVYTELIAGSGVYDDWQINVGTNPNLAHEARTDNPHQVTAAQVGAYTAAEADTSATAIAAAAASAAATALIDGAPSTLNTLDKIAAALGDDASYATSAMAALNNRLRFDAGQTLTEGQKSQAQTNLGGFFATGTSMLFMNAAAPSGWTKQTALNDYALRIVNGAGGTAHSNYNSFTSVFAYRTTDGHALSAAENGTHFHGISGGGANYTQTDGGLYSVRTADGDTPFYRSSNYAYIGSNTDYGGSGSWAHTHNIDMRVHYVDAIICNKT
jgi:hypothetical protein